jgi:hypothetical protein
VHVATFLLQVGFTVAAGLMARLASVFSLFDQPMQLAARPVPPHVLQVSFKRLSRQLPMQSPCLLGLCMHVELHVVWLAMLQCCVHSAW